MAISRQEYRKGPNVTTKTTTSRGDGSNLFNVSETSYGNGNVSIVSDLVTKDIVQTDSAKTVKGNSVSGTHGNHSQWVNEAAEISSNSSYKIVGNIQNVRNGYYQEADMAQAKLAAMRSGFNDDRNETKLLPDINLGGMSSDILKGITVVDKNTVMTDDTPKIPSTGNIFVDIGVLVATEIGNMLTAISKINVKSALKQAELAAKNKIEKTKKMLESITELPESPTKEKIKESISKGDLSVLISSPSNEEKEKKDLYDSEAYQAEAAEATKKLLAVERELT